MCAVTTHGVNVLATCEHDRMLSCVSASRRSIDKAMRPMACLKYMRRLAADGVRVRRKRVARLMSQAGLEGVSRRRRLPTTQRGADAQPVPDLVKRDFAVGAPDRLWVADITYVSTWSGFLYLAIVLDAFSRRVVGWSMATHLRTELVLEALNMAIWRRRPQNVIHHSDQGTHPEREACRDGMLRAALSRRRPPLQEAG